MTVEEVARQVLAAIDSDAGFLLACRWVADRYRQLCSRSRFRHLRQVGELALPAPLASTITPTGTMSVTQGSVLMTSTDPTTVAALTTVGVNALRDRWIRTRTIWMRIVDAQITATTVTLHLEVPYSEVTNATAAYRIVQRFVPLAPNARWIADTMVLMRRRTSIEMLSQVELDLRDPSRILVHGYGPTVWVEVGVDKDGNKLIEFYPYSNQAETVMYVYWTDPPFLQEKDSIPNDIDGYVLREGALIDAMRYEAAKAARAHDTEASALWTNSYRSQSTQWERNVMEAIRTDRGADDITIMLRSIRQRYPGAVVSAHDEVFTRAARP